MRFLLPAAAICCLFAFAAGCETTSAPPKDPYEYHKWDQERKAKREKSMGASKSDSSWWKAQEEEKRKFRDVSKPIGREGFSNPFPWRSSGDGRSSELLEEIRKGR